MSLEDLYREVILDHYRNPRNRSPVDRVDARAEGVNPLCGDEVTVELQFEQGKVEGVSIQSQGCSISQSSASMMSEAIKGLDQTEIESIWQRFRSLLDLENGGAAAGLDADRPGAALGDLEALQGVRKYPVRIKCASLPWTTLEQALNKK